jgi:hypothetical protein
MVIAVDGSYVYILNGVRSFVLQYCVHEVVMSLGSKCPVSPTERSTILPLGMIVSADMLACRREILSQASDGNWSALRNITKLTDPFWKLNLP